MKNKMDKKWMLFLLLSIVLPMGLGFTAGPAVAAGFSAGEFTLNAEYTEEMEPSHPHLTYNLGFELQQTEAGIGFYTDFNLMGDLIQDLSQIELGEVYVEYFGGNHELRVGRQRRAWGTALEINPTDNLNPPNTADPFGEKAPVIMVSGDYYLSEAMTLTGIVIPFHQPAAKEVLLSAGPGGELVSKEAELVADDWANTQYALRIGGKGVYGFDYGLSYLRGFEALPFAQIKKTPTGPVPERIYFREYQVVGAELATGVGGAGLWAEAAYFFPEDGDDYYTAVAGGDYKFGNGLYLVGQLIFKKDRLQNREFLVQQAVEFPLAAIHSLRFGTLYNTETGGFMLRPEAEFSVSDVATLNLTYQYGEGNLFAEMSGGKMGGNSFNVGFSYHF